MSKKVLVPIADGTEEIEAAGIIDTLRRANAEVTVASVGAKEITASRGVRWTADTTLAACAGATYDCIALPGGMPGAEHLRDSAELLALLKAQKAAGRIIAAICAAPAIVLHHHRLIDGVRATCYPSMQSLLDPACVSNDRVVVDGSFVTAQGPAVAIEFALKLVDVLYGPDKAREIGAAMLVPA